ncbi:MAG: hypothetical protein PHG03_00285 [Bacilli bacterium]|nr:hypothetical protein [Bacilli bacterium]
MLELGEEFKDFLKSEILGSSIKSITEKGLSIGSNGSYQIPSFPNMNKILYMELFLYTEGHPTTGSGNFIYPGSGYNYLVASSNLTGTFKGIYAQVSSEGLIFVSNYRHGGVNVIGYRIVYLDL